ncbi:MAG: hypothetical protein KAT05_06725, partial [Spirochaetes bacterium]|nr:hypothetical protein [Spirochaetota bacterium]
PFHERFKGSEVDLASGALIGISSIVDEISQHTDLETIKQKEYCIMLEKGEFVRVAVMSTQELGIIRKKMKHFLEEFELFFAEFLQNFSGNVYVFSPTTTIADKHFDLHATTSPFVKKMEKILTKNSNFMENLKKRFSWIKRRRSESAPKDDLDF